MPLSNPENGKKTLLLKIFRIQKRALGLVNKKDKSYPCRELFQSNKVMTLYSLYIYHASMYVKKNLSTIFHLYHSNHNTRSCSYKVDNNSFPVNSVKFNLVSVYNNLPLSIKSSPSIEVFRRRIKVFLISCAFYNMEEFWSLYNCCAIKYVYIVVLSLTMLYFDCIFHERFVFISSIQKDKNKY